jgi:hypothetical protein
MSYFSVRKPCGPPPPPPASLPRPVCPPPPPPPPSVISASATQSSADSSDHQPDLRANPKPDFTRSALPANPAGEIDSKQNYTYSDLQVNPVVQDNLSSFGQANPKLSYAHSALQVNPGRQVKTETVVKPVPDQSGDIVTPLDDFKIDLSTDSVGCCLFGAKTLCIIAFNITTLSTTINKTRHSS